MEIKKIQQGRHTIFIFNKNPDSIEPEIINPTYVQLNNYEAEDLFRYCTKRFYDNDINPDFNKVILKALDQYLKKEITESDLKKIEEIKAQEAREIDAMRKIKGFY